MGPPAPSLVITPKQPPPGDKMAAMRSAIAAAMSRSKREIPHLYLSTAVEMTNALAWLSTENQKRAVEDRLLPAVLLIKAVARAVVDVPGVNGFWIDDRFTPGAGVHVGCAIALRDGGLVAPGIHDVDRKDLDTVMKELTDLVARARRGTLRSSELADPTITVTNLGELGVEAAFAVIYPPQVAIVGFGRATPRPWVVGDRVEPRPVLTATLSADHRAVDGRRAGQFLAAIERRLQAPEQL
jgi:pyruvate dehydrogenase E2 component (dihydrolipoamide acetyltransferase)